MQGASYADDLVKTIAQVPNTDAVYVEEQKPDYTSQLIKSVSGFEQIPVKTTMQGASYADGLVKTIAQVPKTDVVYVEEQKPDYTSQLVKSVSGFEHIPIKTTIQGDSYADDLKTIVQVPNTDVVYVEEQKPDYTSQLVKSVSGVEQIP